MKVLSNSILSLTFSFFHNGIKMSGSIVASGLFFVREHYTIVKKTIIKSLERGSE